MLPSFLLSALTYSFVVNAAVVERYGSDSQGSGTVSRELSIVNKKLAPDGISRMTVVADGQFPGPLISGKKGDRFMLNVKDELTDETMHRSTSIHWHGLFQAHSVEMDGPAFVTQCPIIPDHSFLYDFQVPDQAGTFWYHSHLSTQYCDGLRGPLVIYDPQDPMKHLYDIDDESTVITLADWYHNTSTSLFPGTNKTAPNPDTTLVNGLGRWSEATEPSPLAVVSAKPGKRHRFRIINAACFPSYKFSIDGHRMTIIETDGETTQPHTVDSLEIFAGQRYSVIVEADQPVGNYWIRAIPSTGTNTTDGGVNSAILRYDGADDCEPQSAPTPNGIVLNEADLEAFNNPGAPGAPYPGGADVNINLLHGFDPKTGNFLIHNATFVAPSMPVLLQILSGKSTPEDLLPKGSVIPLPANKTIEISMPGGGNHPFHLHGHTFDVVRAAGSTTYNYANPVRRDVVSIGGPQDNVTFRFRTDNPGPWFLHCHIDWHLEAGLAVVFAEDTEGIKKSTHPGEQYDQLCPLYDKYNPDKHLQSA
ncbi:type-2 Cu-depleted laccase [Schizopora paradoxa]|uniref:Type-2 Cu-depleted laccase n=1 Tax=Schizopora paradoxa TaxID=27342 RepID=A0A0H2S1X8_9AGAM|nr:type-2 Cu-depleted laccase [Schizopora paradoxa]